MSKILAILSLSLCAALYGLYWQVQASGELRAEIRQQRAEIGQQSALIEKERAELKKANDRANKSFEEKQNDKAELDRLRSCVANKSCGVRVVKGACPMPSAATATEGADAAYASDRRQFEQDYLNLIESQKEARRLYNWMQSELIARSSPDYCQPK